MIEAVFEDLQLKQDIFRRLDKAAPERTVLLSNTSTYLPSALAASTSRPDRVAVAHYFNPPHLLPIVELVRGPETSDQTIETARDLLLRVGKRPALVNREILGFIGNRLQAALFREALALVEQGVASVEDVDAVVKYGFGRRLSVAGPFEVWEQIGWDLVATIKSELFPDIDRSTTVPKILSDKVARGELGTKTGKGFYDWTPESAEALRPRISRAPPQNDNPRIAPTPTRNTPRPSHGTHRVHPPGTHRGHHPAHTASIHPASHRGHHPSHTAAITRHTPRPPPVIPDPDRGSTWGNGPTRSPRPVPHTRNLPTSLFPNASRTDDSCGRPR